MKDPGQTELTGASFEQYHRGGWAKQAANAKPSPHVSQRPFFDLNTMAESSDSRKLFDSY